LSLLLLVLGEVLASFLYHMRENEREEHIGEGAGGREGWGGWKGGKGRGRRRGDWKWGK